MRCGGGIINFLRGFGHPHPRSPEYLSRPHAGRQRLVPSSSRAGALGRSRPEGRRCAGPPRARPPPIGGRRGLAGVPCGRAGPTARPAEAHSGRAGCGRQRVGGPMSILSICERAADGLSCTLTRGAQWSSRESDASRPGSAVVGTMRPRGSDIALSTIGCGTLNPGGAPQGPALHLHLATSPLHLARQGRPQSSSARAATRLAAAALSALL